MSVCLTGKQFDYECDLLSEVENPDPGYVPTIDEINELLEASGHSGEAYLYLWFVSETYDGADMDDEQRAGLEYLKSLLKENITVEEA